MQHFAGLERDMRIFQLSHKSGLDKAKSKFLHWVKVPYPPSSSHQSEIEIVTQDLSESESPIALSKILRDLIP